jgi:hypothetical protein
MTTQTTPSILSLAWTALLLVAGIVQAQDLTFVPIGSSEQTINGELFSVHSAFKDWSIARSPLGGVHRFEVRQGEKRASDDSGLERSELKNQHDYAPEADLWNSYAVLAEPGDPFSVSWECLGQWHAGVGSPVVTMQMRNRTTLEILTRSGSSSTAVKRVAWATTSFVPGRWYHVVQHVRLDPRGGRGVLQVWLDGVAVINDTASSIGYSDMTRTYWKFGIYRNTSPTVQAVRYANMEVGTADLSARIANPLPIEGAALGAANQRPTVAQPATSPGSAQVGAPVALAALGADDGGEAALVYTWSATGPAGVSFSANGSNAAKSTSATFVAVGTYACTVRISDAEGLAVGSMVSVVIASANQAPIVASAARTLGQAVAGGTMAISVRGADDGGESALTYVWSASGPGAVAFAANRTNAAKATTATFAIGGSYRIVATIRDAFGLTTTSAVDALVESPQAPTLIAEAVVGTGSDDAEERIGSGSVDIASSDLELTHEGNAAQVVGLRFRSVAVPRGAIIVDARIQFAVDETSSAAASLIIRGQAADSAPTFTTRARDITDRARTSAAVVWKPGAWTVVGSQGDEARTPTLTAVVQEIVSRSGWEAGNALAIIIDGSGKRVAHAKERSSARPALLIVTYRPPAAPLGSG